METRPPDNCPPTQKNPNPGWRLDTLRPLLKKFQHNLFSPPVEKMHANQQVLPWVLLDEEHPDS